MGGNFNPQILMPFLYSFLGFSLAACVTTIVWFHVTRAS
jgi:hypothetical protein